MQPTKKFSQLPPDSTPTTDDYIATTDATSTQSKKVLLSDLLTVFFTQTAIPSGGGSPVTRHGETLFDFVASGGVWAGDSYGVNRAASMSAMVCYINGYRISITAVSARTFTASKDTYIDVLSNQDGTGTLVYTEVTNNAASPALAANSIRIGIIVTGATTIAAAGSVNQGQETKVLPIASSIAYSVTDSLGNLICSRDATRSLLGYRQTTAATTTTASTTDVQVTGLSCPVIVPTNRKVKLTVYCRDVFSAVGAAQMWFDIWDGVVSSGTQIEAGVLYTGTASQPFPMGTPSVPVTPATPSKTYNAGFHTGTGANSANLEAGATYPAYIMAELS